MGVPLALPPDVFRYASIGCAGFGLIGSLVTICGWFFNISILTDWRSTGISMMPNTAICAVALSSSLIFFVTKYKTLSVSLSVLGGSLAALTLFQHITGINLFIDQLFIKRNWGHAGTVVPGRMGLPASCSLTLLGMALISANIFNKRYVVGLTIAVMCITLFSIVGYILNADPFFAVPTHTAIAWQTSIIVLTIAIGTLCQTSELQPLRMLSEDTAAGSLFRWAIPLVFLAPITLGWLRLAGQRYGLYNNNFGTALQTVVEIFLLAVLLWWSLKVVKAHEAPLRVSVDRLNDVLTSISDRFQTISSDWRITYQNAAMQRALKDQGIDPTNILEKNVFDVFPEFRGTAEASALEKAMAQRIEVEYELFYVPWKKWVWVRASPNSEGGLTIISRDITDRKAAEDSLRLSQQELSRKAQQLNTYLETAAVGLHRVGPDGIIKWANEADYSLLGYNAEEYIGQHIASFHADKAAINDILTRLKAGEKLRDYSARLLCKDGSVKSVLIDSSVYWEEGKFIHTQCFTRDVTEREQLEQSLRENDRKKDEFLATLAHELRNPLAPILNAASLIKSNASSEDKVLKFAEIIGRQTKQLIKLVDDLLDVSRINRGKIDLRPEPLELEAVINQALETCATQIAQKNQNLIFNRSGRSVKVLADNVRLTQVFSNLLNNACKYTPSGGRISIEIDIRNSNVIVTIKDSGIGIIAEDIYRVFELFAQVRTPMHAPSGGLGIGLSLVKKLIEMQNGRITAFSEGPNKGSSFSVSLPLLEMANTATESSRIESIPHPVNSMKVLIADDNKDCAETFEFILKLSGHQTETVNDGQTAVLRARQTQPDVILLDLGMPHIDGFEVCRQIRSEPWGKRIIIIAQTGWGTENDQRRTKEAGFDAHLVKPVDAAVLLQTIEAMCARDSDAKH
ncbi:ATP-binding protein [Oscillatoria laete-virens NRMC-F 0139]|nr:ATP-binding protein [Oscillatoria laete-virens]MDL5051984.1 ATP-binding protein [Oscillatoria laete-virens NRMC-F 0139]